jgi:hypothetical protein
MGLNGDTCSNGNNYKERIMVQLACNAHGIEKTFNISYWKSENPNHSKTLESCLQNT